MKDFLQGRPAATAANRPRPDSPSVNHLPPIHPPQPEPAPLPVPENEGMEQPPADEQSPCALAEPQVELVPDAEGRIGHIVVTCRCGEQTILQCSY